MKISRFLFLLLPVISCTLQPEPAFVTVINNNESNITWVALVDAKTGYPVVSERGYKLIEKDSSKTFEVKSEELPGDFTVCVKTEGTSEFICTDKFTLQESDKRSFAMPPPPKVKSAEGAKQQNKPGQILWPF